MCLAKLTTKPPAELVAHSRHLEVELFSVDRSRKAVQLAYETEVAARMDAEEKLLQLEKRFEAVAPLLAVTRQMLKPKRNVKMPISRPVKGTFDSGINDESYYGQPE